MRRLFLFLFIIALFPGHFANKRRHHQDVFRSVCELARDNYYQRDSDFVNWVSRCFANADATGFLSTTPELLQRIQDQLDEMRVSHFRIYDPNEDKRLWKGESLDTGIRSRYVEDHLLVSRVLPGTTAEAEGIRAGDEILAMEGTEQVTPWGAQHRAGRFVILRQGQRLEFLLNPSSVVVESKPSLKKLGAGAAVLEISSFRAEFFPHGFWRQFARQLADPKSGINHIIVDLRENSGGNFVAMLRALSPFMCGTKSIGKIVQPRRLGQDKDAFADELEDEKQLEELDQYHSLGLRTFADYGCFTGQVTVLVGSQTASVAEIFAEAMMHRPNSRVWGQPTAGDVLLAVWYELPRLGPGYSLSIPQAVYLTRDRKTLENTGVMPQKELYYDLEVSRRGQDSWIVESLR